MAWAWVLLLPLVSCVLLGKLLNLLIPPFFHVLSKYNNRAYLKGLLEETNDLMHVVLRTVWLIFNILPCQLLWFFLTIKMLESQRRSPSSFFQWLWLWLMLFSNQLHWDKFTYNKIHSFYVCSSMSFNTCIYPHHHHHKHDVEHFYHPKSHLCSFAGIFLSWLSATANLLSTITDSLCPFSNCI